ncbi:hypothetical protein F8388_002248 [Cannabis sativa]|uniref:Major facilitator superfamily (MFS) profile domain-containing protein n=1 Tax=Cannabis sativa TaxID=3483 RepID=A0A7J6FX56_CANSA|nr:hypothetical protein F8388_002248 [Cannabis sativa]
MSARALLYSFSPKPNLSLPDISGPQKKLRVRFQKPGPRSDPSTRTGKVWADVKSESFEVSESVPETVKLKDAFNDVVSVKEDLEGVSPWWEEFPKRWVIVILCFSAFLLCKYEHSNTSHVSRVQLETPLLLFDTVFIFWGYLLTQIAGGIWADKVGGKKVLGFGVVWWSVATILTPFAARMGLPFLLVVRAFMGVGEGVAMPAMNNILSKWVPVSERSRSLALVYSGMYIGSVTGFRLFTFLIHQFGWSSVFYSFGSLGTVWFTIWLNKAYSSPLEDPQLRPEEKKLILTNNGAEVQSHRIWTLLCLAWLTMAFSANLGGWIADTLISKGYSVTTVRKGMQTIGFLGPAFFLTQLSHINSPAMAVLCMACSQGTDAFSQSGLYSNHQDIAPRYSGVLLGLSNTAGVLAGVFGTAATGYILQHGSWDDVFNVSVGLYLAGTVVWNVFSTGEKIID